MNELKQQDSRNQFRIVGEDAPKWLTIGFGVIGTFVAAAAAWLWIAQAPQPQEQTTRGGASLVQDAAPTSQAEANPTPVKPIQSPVATPQGMATEEKQTGVGVGSPVSAGNVADAPARPSPSAESTADQQPAPVIAQAPARREDCPALITIPFKFDSATLNPPEIRSGTEGVLDWMNKNPEAKVYVQGYADSAGWDQYNLLLSYRRAKAVAASLSKAGIPAQRIIIRAAGSHEPVEGMPADAGANRRVTLQITGIDGCR